MSSEKFKSMHDAIIFDVDGTLWNASIATAKAWNHGLASLGIKRTLTPNDIESVAGNPFDQCVNILLPELATQYPSLVERLDEYERKVIKKQGGKLYAGVLEGMKDLAKTHRLFLVSNCQSWYLDAFLSFSGLAHLLSGHDCNGASRLSKEQMLAKMSQAHDLCNPVYVGDTSGDESAAVCAKMPFIHVTYGFGTPVNPTLAFNSFPTLASYFSST